MVSKETGWLRRSTGDTSRVFPLHPHAADPLTLRCCSGTCQGPPSRHSCLSPEWQLASDTISPFLSSSPIFQIPLKKTCCFGEACGGHLTPRFQVIEQDMMTNLRKMTPALRRKPKSIPSPHLFFELPPFPAVILPHPSYSDRNLYI